MIRGRKDSCWISPRAKSPVLIALIGVGLFEMSLNSIINKLSVLSYDTYDTVRDSTQNLPIRSVTNFMLMHRPEITSYGADVIHQIMIFNMFSCSMDNV